MTQQHRLPTDGNDGKPESAGPVTFRALKPRPRTASMSEAEAFANLVMRLNAASSLPEVIELAVQGTKVLLKGDDASLWLVEPDGDRLCCHYETDNLGSFGAQVVVADYPNTTQALSQCRPVYVSLVTVEEAGRAFLNQLGLWGAIILPLVAGGHGLGVIYIYFRSMNYHPAKESIAFGETIARQCALAVERATLYEQERLARAEAELRAGHFQALISTISDGVTIVDGDGEIVLRNQRSAEITGVSGTVPNDDGEHPCASVIGPDGNPVAAELTPVGRVLAGEVVQNQEILIRRHDGTERTVVWSGGAIRDESGAVALAIITFRDVTEMRRLEAARNQFLQVLAHELRNPLAAAMGLVELTAQRLPEVGHDWVVERLSLAGAELERLRFLIGEIISGYQISAGRLPLNLKGLDLVRVVEKASRPYIAGFASHRITVTGPSHAVPVQGDEPRLVELIANLLSNSVKYTAAGGRIWVSTTLEPAGDAPAWGVVRVADEGIGIPPDQLEAVFEGFYRASNLKDLQPGGVGLGLYISRDIARRHGGELWAENRPEGGTAICLRLPLAKEDPSGTDTHR